MAGKEDFLGELEALTKFCTEETEHKLSKRAPVVKKVPMLLSEESEPLKTILICHHQPEERILIVKEFEDACKRKRR